MVFESRRSNKVMDMFRGKRGKKKKKKVYLNVLIEY